MNFTHKTYRVAIQRSVEAEQRWLQISEVSWGQPMKIWSPAFMAYLEQLKHTRKLQARKRRERK